MANHYVTSPVDGYLKGTLRHAVSNARSGDCIICLWPPSMALMLVDRLRFRTNNLTIIGNGRVIRFGFGFWVEADRIDIRTLSFDHVAGDAIMVDRPEAGSCIIRDCIFIGGNRNEDEAVSVVRGAGANLVRMVDCTVRNYGKAVLVGTGDPEHKPVEAAAKLSMEGCVLEGNSRRHPRIRYGHARLQDCIIEYWGAVWNDFCVGVQADQGATVELENCIFKQRFRYILRPIKTIRDIIAGGGPWRAVKKDASSIVTGRHKIQWRW